jgi:phospholipid/cholesterol/gamma-HCH transport system substrate-binding protein
MAAREPGGRDLMVGLFVLAGLAAVAYLSATLGGVSLRGRGGVQLVAKFDEIGGLRPRSPVVIGGVKVGQIKTIGLDTDLRPRVVLSVQRGVSVPADSSASILTSGVLGDQYIAIEPGAEEAMLQDGDEIQYTQSAVILERLIGKLVQNLGVDSKDAEK